MLKQLELTNFQKHAHLTLDFTNGVNIIHGETDCGKSCIVRAIKWVFFGEPKGDVVRKEGTKKTSVEVTLDNGTIIEKIKSASVNAYILTVGKDVKRFDAVGKTIPEEILTVLKSRTIRVNGEEIILNIANQISLPFLLDKSGTFRMKLFNQLTGNDIIDKVFQSLNKDILHIGREEKLEKEHLEEGKSALKDLQARKDDIEFTCKALNGQYNILKKNIERYNKINEYDNKLIDINIELNKVQLQLNGIHTIKENELLNLDEKVKRLEKLNELLYKIKTVKKELLSIEEQLKKTIIPEIDIKEIRSKLEQLTKLQKMITQLDDITKADKDFTSKIAIITVKIEEDSKKYKQLLKDIKICPFHKKECPLNKEI